MTEGPLVGRPFLLSIQAGSYRWCCQEALAGLEGRRGWPAISQCMTLFEHTTMTLVEYQRSEAYRALLQAPPAATASLHFTLSPTHPVLVLPFSIPCWALAWSILYTCAEPAWPL